MGMQVIADMARRLGLGQKFALPFPSQSYGTVPDPAWKMKKYGKEWKVYDTVNATIGQGYMLANPTQLAVMAARLGSGRAVVPRFLLDEKDTTPPPIGVKPEHMAFIHDAMNQVVNGEGTARKARMNVPDVLLAGKPGRTEEGRGGNGGGSTGKAW